MAEAPLLAHLAKTGRGPVILLGTTTNSAGFAESRFPLPLDVRLRGATSYAQAVVADPQGAVAGIALSAGLRLIVGD